MNKVKGDTKTKINFEFFLREGENLNNKKNETKKQKKKQASQGEGS